MSQTEREGEMTELISAHVTPDQKREIRIEAAKADVTMSEYVRRQLLSDEGE